MKSLIAILLLALVVAILSSLSAQTANPIVSIAEVPRVDVANDRGKRISFRTESTRSFVLFGYTRCRDVCPLELSELVRDLKELPQRVRPRVLFVTIDPRYDDPRVLATYLATWGGAVEGITGDPQTIARIYAAFTGALQPPSVANDHDSQIFVVDAVGELTPAPDTRSRTLVALARSLAKGANVTK
jgi:cytochrome oxidase Cu insertion factor (SCO1/SenC/PrrC family)